MMHSYESWMKAREAHYEQHFGPLSEPVMHSSDDTLPHIDVYQFKPTADRDYWTLITGGMSSSRQFMPPGAPGYVSPRVELLMYVREPKPWMFKALKDLAEYPFENETCLHWGHTVPNSRPIGRDDSLLSAFLFLPPYYEARETFGNLKIDGDTVDMLWVVPITSAEHSYASKHGSKALDDLLVEAELDPVVDEQRPSLV
jgi:hypothetical protein